MSLATMRNNILRFVAGLHPALVDSCIQDAYKQLSAEDWKVLKRVRSTPTVAPYSTGTVTVDSVGVVTGVGTTFTSSMVDRYMKVYYSSSFFRISAYSSPTSITLEDWTGITVSSATTYSIFNMIYSVASVFKQVFEVAYQTSLSKRSQAYFNRVDPGRSSTGSPAWWAFAGYDSSRIPRIEIYPVPDAVYPLRIYGKLAFSALADSDSPNIPEELVEARALLSCYMLKETQEPNRGWKALKDQQSSFYTDIYERAKSEDYELNAHRDKVKDVMGEPSYPTGDDFWVNHDVW